MGQIHTVGPNRALIVSGGCVGGQDRKKMVVGGWAWAWWCVSDVQEMSLEVMTLLPNCPEVETSQVLLYFDRGRCKLGRNILIKNISNTSET